MSEPDTIAVPATTHLFLLDEGGILFSEHTRSLHVVNAAAAYIWCALEDGRPLSRIREDLLARDGPAPEAIDGLMRGVIGKWRQQGLLSPDAGTPATDAERPSGPVAPTPKPARTRTYALLDSRIAVGYADAAQETAVHPVLAHLETAGEPDDAVPVILTREDDGHVVWVEGQRRFSTSDVDAPAPQVKYHVLTLAMAAHDHIFNIHAGVVGHDGGALLLPGAKGSGKTALTAALVAAGFDYLSDEVAPLGRADCSVRPVPLALCVKDSGLALQAGLFPGVADLLVHARQDGLRVRYLPMPPAATADRDHAIRWVVFPRYRDGGTNDLTPLDKLTGLKRLIQESVAVPRSLTIEDVARLVHHLERVSYFELDTGEIGGAVAAIRGMVGA